MTSATPAEVILYFHPSHWGDKFLQLTPLNKVTQVEMEREIDCLKKEVFESFNKPLGLLNLIDAIERLGLAYHFEKEIEEALTQLYENYHDQSIQDDLFHVSTRFRILRQHGFYVPCDVFNKFKDDKGGFNSSCLLNNVQGILSLYEASHVRIHGDDILDEAFAFTSTYLKLMVDKLSTPLNQLVAHSLHQPLHLGIVRLESKNYEKIQNYISFYEQDSSHNQILLKLAKLDFNFLQLIHQQELQEISRWWMKFYPKVPFTRDRLVEAYFWVLGCYYEPQYSPARKIFIKIFMIILVFDDIFDAYGTCEILELLVEAVNRWDYSYIDLLPKYFSSCYQVLLETVDEIEEELAKEGKSYGVRYVKQQMNRVCEVWLKEAYWCQQKYTPKYDEYMEVAILSIAHIIGINASFLGMGASATKEGYEWVCQDPMPKMFEASNLIFRLMNDIGSNEYEQTSRKHVVSSVQCYMKDNGILDREHVYQVLEKKIEDAWKDLNQGMLQPYAIPKPLMDRILQITRGIDVFYKGRMDGFTIVNQVIKDKITSVLVDSISL